MQAHPLIGMLAEPARLRVVAALVLGARTHAQVAERTGLTVPEVARAVRRLQGGGLVSSSGGRLEVRTELFAEAARAQAAPPEPVDPTVTDPDTAAVLRAFVRDGRLTGVPVAAGKRRILLEYLVSVFEPGVRYSEAEVNVTLRAWYPDHAALRRYLVDEGLLAREAGVYWRTGGVLLGDAEPDRDDRDG